MTSGNPPTPDSPPGRIGRWLRQTHFWRATRYLAPYKRLVIGSVVLALLAGGVFAGSVPAIFPILQTLLYGDTPQMWIDRQVAEARWGVDLADDPQSVRVVRVEPGGPAAQAFADASAPEVVLNRSLAVASAPSATPAQTLRLIAQAPGGDWMNGAPGVAPAPTPLHLRAGRSVIYLLPADPVGAIAVIMGGIVLLAVASGLLRFLQEYLSSKAALSAVNDVRSELYQHVLRLPMTYFGSRGTGDATSRLVNDAGQLQHGLTVLLGPTVQQPIMATFAFWIAMIIDWRLTLFIVAFAPVMGLVLRSFGRRMRRAGSEALATNAELLSQAEATLRGIRVVKSSVGEDYESSRLKQVLDRLLRFQLKMQKYDAASSPTMEMLSVLAVALIVVVMVYLVRQQGSLSVAGALIIFGCLAQMADSMRRLAKLNTVLQKSNAAADRIFQTMDLPPEPGGRAAVELRPLAREIVFENVCFRYAPDTPPALEAVSLAVNKGESIAIVGRNGSGKTTLLSLLPRFFDPDQGAVLIDGVDIREVSLASLRDQIGVVTQEAVIFPGTVAENIAYATTDATRKEIESAARQAEAHDFIMAKAQGYDTPLTGLGSQLSGGQRQRLNIARAILRDPPILILDEATSQVDAESEHLIQQAIHRLMQGRTVFVIAHRFSTILDCDRIALLEAGRLEALGTHQEMLETSELYRQLYDRQLVGV